MPLQYQNIIREVKQKFIDTVLVLQVRCVLAIIESSNWSGQTVLKEGKQTTITNIICFWTNMRIKINFTFKSPCWYATRSSSNSPMFVPFCLSKTDRLTFCRNCSTAVQISDMPVCSHHLQELTPGDKLHSNMICAKISPVIACDLPAATVST